MLKIQGEAVASVQQLREYIKKVNKNVSQSVLDMTEYYIEEGKAEGIRGDIAFAQSCLETGNFTFKDSAVTLEQNNFAGLGVTQQGMRGNAFSDARTGIRAQVQHLKAYANKEALKNTCVDVRFSYVTRGSAPYVEWLGIQENPNGGGWASGKNYGNKIIDILNQILDCKGVDDKMVINVHAGHNSIVQGATGIFSETTEDRKVKELVIAKLKKMGNTVYDCTDDTAKTVMRNLEVIVEKCNAHTADLDVSIHFNCATGSAHGVEVCVYSKDSRAVSYAKNIATSIAELGFTKRHSEDGGIVVRNNLYVLHHTNAPALLVECCFCDNETDAKLYNAEAMATAIVKGITGQVVNTTTTNTKKEETQYMFKPLTCRVGDKNTSVLLLQEILKARGYYKGDLDRSFGKSTMEAVNAYQKKRMTQGKKLGNGVGDGICGQDMWEDLIAI